ncbi:DUF3679 domain-containing protein [Tumebacillus sp. DT12]|uniref:DUF3679 domain-containing protein n=1 Tax=Tumebacillus lacus TaxID=2995335 RepID=A0ABT3X4B1_9BACL|nr:DUF3679 domain-containing protein [Tumebacillus lacus]MCX7570803.1 DUF3679 domain-containing protein [Tumebacillus lacus]
MRSLMEQTAVYGILMVMLALMVLFGIQSAEKGIQSLTGSDDPQALAVTGTQNGQVDLRVLGKDLSSTEIPWADRLSDQLEGQESIVGDLVDSAALNIGDWMQAGAQTLLEKLNGWLR